MAQPTDRATFKSYCLRALGDGVVKVNVTDAQVEDRIDDAIQAWQEAHEDGYFQGYAKHLITATDITNAYIPVPEALMRVEGIIPLANRMGTNSIFNLEYQLHLNDIFDLTFAGGLINYTQTKQYLSLLDRVLHGKDTWSYNRHGRELHLHIDWTKDTEVGKYILIKGWYSVDPETVAEAYTSKWLKAYATALIKRQWGENLSLYSGVEMIGGITFNGERLMSEALTTIEKLEEELYDRYSPPPMPLIG